ncbi:MAG: PP2C family protein-serine/threonine phosphatase [Treponemataceae bacterium]
MIRRQKFFSQLVICIISALVFVFFMAFISPRVLFLGKFDAAQYMSLSLSTFDTLPELNVWIRAVIAGLSFILIAFFTQIVIELVNSQIEKISLGKEKTKLFVDFIEDLKIANSNENLIATIQQGLEYRANCEVVLVESETNFVIYNSGARFTSDPKVFNHFTELFKNAHIDNVYFFDDDLKLVKNKKTAKGFCVVTEKSRFIVLCRFLKDVENYVFMPFLNEYLNFENREETLAKLLDLSELAQEWNMVAETQMSFLPAKLPQVKGLDIGAYYRPLVNVSGDYYDIIPVDEDKTIFIVGDVSGKGLPAALIMGVVINTVRIAPDKENLEQILRMVDTAIKRMNLVDKYTVLFLSLIDTKKMTIKYINASIENPMILTQAADGYKIKTLDSNASVIGIIDLDDIVVEEKPLYRGDVLLMMTDGIPETTNTKGVELGETEEYITAIKNYARRDAEQIVKNIASLAFSYAIGSRIRDDITIVAVKLKG